MSSMTLDLMRLRADKPTIFELGGDDLAPCPFCHTSEVHYDNDGGNSMGVGALMWIACNKCGAQGPPPTCRRYALKLWQNRTHGHAPDNPAC